MLKTMSPSKSFSKSPSSSGFHSAVGKRGSESPLPMTPHGTSHITGHVAHRHTLRLSERFVFNDLLPSPTSLVHNNSTIRMTDHWEIQSNASDISNRSNTSLRISHQTSSEQVFIPSDVEMYGGTDERSHDMGLDMDPIIESPQNANSSFNYGNGYQNTVSKRSLTDIEDHKGYETKTQSPSSIRDSEEETKYDITVLPDRKSIPINDKRITKIGVLSKQCPWWVGTTYKPFLFVLRANGELTYYQIQPNGNKIKMGEIQITASTYIERRSGGDKRDAKFVIHTDANKYHLWCNGSLNDQLSKSYKYTLGPTCGQTEAREWCDALNNIIEQKRKAQYQPTLVPNIKGTRKSNHTSYSYPISNDMRSNAWFVLSGARDLMLESGNVYELLTETVPSNTKSYDQIEKDLPRTFCNEELDEKYGDSLRRVLIAYCNYNENVTYCQGMNFVAAFVLKQFFHKAPDDTHSHGLIDEFWNDHVEEQSFWTFVAIMNEIAPLFDHELVGFHKAVSCFKKIFNYHAPEDLVNHLNAENVYLMVLTAWWHTMYTHPSMNENMAKQIWDVFFLEKMDFSIILQVSYLILIRHKSVLMQMDFIQICEYCKSAECFVFDGMDDHDLIQRAFKLKLNELYLKPMRNLKQIHRQNSKQSVSKHNLFPDE